MTQQPQQLAPVIDAFFDPVQDVTNALAASGHPNPTAWQAELQVQCPGAFDKASSGTWRRMMVNRCLHLIIAETNDPKADMTRYLLVDQGTHEEWKTLIDENVAPFLARTANVPK